MNSVWCMMQGTQSWCDNLEGYTREGDGKGFQDGGDTCMHTCVLSHFSWVWLFATPWTVAHQVLLHGILQARKLEWVASALLQGTSPWGIKPCDSYVSWIGSWILYHQHHLGSTWIPMDSYWCMAKTITIL